MDQSFRGSPAIRPSAAEAGEQASRTYHRFQQAAGGNAVPKLKPVGDQPLDSQILRQRTHDLFQALAHQDNFIPGLDTHPKLFYCINF